MCNYSSINCMIIVWFWLMAALQLSEEARFFSIEQIWAYCTEIFCADDELRHM